MNELINTIEQTMSSFEIAKLTGKRHDHVILENSIKVMKNCISPKLG